VAARLGFSFTEGPRDYTKWNAAVSGLEHEPEGSHRCEVCFKFRIERACQFMRESGFEAFTTTLTMGSNKPGKLISRLGREIGGDKFLERDFKKKCGIQRAGVLAKQWGLYRQWYCGCKYSLKETEKRLLNKRH